MPRKLERALSPRKVNTAPPGMWADGGCLYLQVTIAAGGGLNRSWIFRYGVPGDDGRTRYRDFGMGSASTFTLAEAREAARQLRQKRYAGIDLVEERKAQRATAAPKIVTVAEISDQWMTAHPEWKPQYARAHRQRLRDFILPKIGKLSVRAVATPEVCQVLDPIWTVIPNTASMTRMTMEQVLDFARGRGHRDDDSNPARWQNLKAIYPAATKLRTMKRKAEGKGDHHADMPYRDVAAFMAELRAMNDVAAMALEFVILTAARTSEVLGMPWSEVDLAAKTWTVPGSRMKKGREHRVPLSDAAVAVLNRVGAVRIDDSVFPGLSDKSMRRLLQDRMKRPFAVHGFRGSFSTWAGEETHTPRDVIEAALAHYVGGVEGAYNHGTLFKKRCGLMDAWAAYVGPVMAGKVVALPKKKRAAG